MEEDLYNNTSGFYNRFNLKSVYINKKTEDIKNWTIVFEPEDEKDGPFVEDVYVGQPIAEEVFIDTITPFEVFFNLAKKIDISIKKNKQKTLNNDSCIKSFLEHNLTWNNKLEENIISLYETYGFFSLKHGKTEKMFFNNKYIEEDLINILEYFYSLYVIYNIHRCKIQQITFYPKIIDSLDITENIDSINNLEEKLYMKFFNHFNIDYEFMTVQNFKEELEENILEKVLIKRYKTINQVVSSVLYSKIYINTDYDSNYVICKACGRWINTTDSRQKYCRSINEIPNSEGYKLAQKCEKRRARLDKQRQRQKKRK